MTEIRLEKSLPSEQERVGQPSVPAEGLERYFAREGVDPLPYAFEGKIAVHPGLGGAGVEKQDFEATLEPLLAEPRTGKTVAYIHVPFCETHCLYCGFYNKAYREDESRIYADALIQELTETPDLIVVARVPAFSDPNFVAKHYSSALTTTSGDLWMDERRCYWLRPDSIDAQSYLAAIALELDSLGFDEVLFDNFYVPSDSSIAWDTEAITPVAALEDCAENLTANLTGSSIRLALGTSVPSVAQYASRVFVTTERANDVLSVTDAMTEVLPDPATQLVFVTTSHDTRFDASGVIRPLLGDSSGE